MIVPKFENNGLNKKLEESLLLDKDYYVSTKLPFVLYREIYLNSSSNSKQILHSSILADIKSKQNILSNNELIFAISNYMKSKAYNLYDYTEELFSETNASIDFEKIKNTGVLFDSIILNIQPRLNSNSVYGGQQEFEQLTIYEKSYREDEKIYYDDFDLEKNFDHLLDLLNQNGKIYLVVDQIFMNYGFNAWCFIDIYDGFDVKLFSYGTFFEKNIKYLSKFFVYDNDVFSKKNYGILEFSKKNHVTTDFFFNLQSQDFFNLNKVKNIEIPHFALQNDYYNPSKPNESSFLDYNHINSFKPKNLKSEFQVHDINKLLVNNKYNWLELTNLFPVIDFEIEDKELNESFFNEYYIFIEYLNILMRENKLKTFLFSVKNPNLFNQLMYPQIASHPNFKGTLSYKLVSNNFKKISYKDQIVFTENSKISNDTLPRENKITIESLDQDLFNFNYNTYDLIFLDSYTIEEIDDCLNNKMHKKSLCIIIFTPKTEFDFKLKKYYELADLIIYDKQNDKYFISFRFSKKNKISLLEIENSDKLSTDLRLNKKIIKNNSLNIDSISSIFKKEIKSQYNDIVDKSKSNSDSELIRKIYDNTTETKDDVKEVKDDVKEVKVDVKEIKSLFEKIYNLINEVRKSVQKNTVSNENGINKILTHIDNSGLFDEMKDYENSVINWFNYWKKLEETSRKFMPRAEFLLSNISSSNFDDYSPFVLYYCRTLEYELLNKIFISYHDYINDTFPNKKILFEYVTDKLDEKTIENIESGQISHFIRKFKLPNPKYTLGDMRFILALLPNKNKPQGSKRYQALLALQELNKFINGRIGKIPSQLIEKIEIIISEYRNPSAHVGEISKTQADKFYSEFKILMNGLFKSFDKIN